MDILKKTAAMRVEKQTSGKAADEVTSISLSDVPALPELWAPYKNLTHLTLVNMKPPMKSLSELSLSKYPKMRVLAVSDNRITVPESLPVMPAMRRLLMANNDAADMEEVKRLAAAFPGLEVLDLAESPVDTKENFSEIFALFPDLIALNSRNEEGEEVYVEESDESDEDDDEEDYDESDDEEDDDSDAPQRKRARKEGGSESESEFDEEDDEEEYESDGDDDDDDDEDGDEDESD